MKNLTLSDIRKDLLMSEWCRERGIEGQWENALPELKAKFLSGEQICTICQSPPVEEEGTGGMELVFCPPDLKCWEIIPGWPEPNE